MYEAIPLWLLFKKIFVCLFRGQFPSLSLWVQSPRAPAKVSLSRKPSATPQGTRVLLKRADVRAGP